ncbi:hypothetical protein V6N12_026575 [Hibiscus sabdariffa]|uniref:Uncharacterized protein n=1 Tax=Hibiscus sabdariffa TaxID=183260 RepID=A0ABR2DS58_9ROSI
MTVADLINHSEKVWKLDILHELFEEDQDERICSIPISRGVYIDDIIWRLEGSGCYTVKSGYRLLQNASRAMVPHISAFFSDVWSVELPPKVRITMWRIANNFLPTYDNLQRRRLVVINICPFCDSPGETVVHLMRDCAFCNQLLAVFNLTPSHVLGEESWIDWLASFFLSLSANDRRLVLVIYWFVWYSRNKLVHEGYKSSIYEIISFVSAFIREQDSICVLKGTTRPSVISHWMAPPSPAIKINFDSAFNQHDSLAVSGALGRNSEGLIMAACAIPHSNVPDSFVAEALACQQAVLLAMDVGLSNVIIEGDSLTVIKKINAGSHDRSVIAPIIVDIKELAKNFSAISFRFVRREANKVVHALARECRSCQTPYYWLEEAPMEATTAAEAGCFSRACMAFDGWGIFSSLSSSYIVVALGLDGACSYPKVSHCDAAAALPQDYLSNIKKVSVVEDCHKVMDCRNSLEIVASIRCS